MGRGCVFLLALVAFTSSVVPGCAEKKTRGITFEGPDSEVSFQMETTDKTPDDDEDEEK